MTYTLHDLEPGGYNLALDGVIVGSMARKISARGTIKGWCDVRLPQGRMVQVAKTFQRAAAH